MDLQINPKENINERVPPKWITNLLLSPDVTPILIGCQYARNCKEGPQCSYLLPQYEHSDMNTTQVINIYSKVNMTVDTTYHSHTNDKYNEHIRYDNVINVNTSMHTTAKTTTGGIPESTSQGSPFSITTTLKGWGGVWARRERIPTLQGTLGLQTNREETTSLQ